MGFSQSIVSLKPIKWMLESMCILPFQESSRSQYAYYIATFLVYEIVFFSVFYLSLFSSGAVKIHADDYDTFYFIKLIKRSGMGACFGLSVIFSMCSRSAQLELQKRMNALDIMLTSVLRVEPSFCRLNIEFILCCIVIAIYYYGDYFFYLFAYAKLTELSHIIYQIYYGGVIYAETFFYVYGFYATYWARAYLQRSEYIIEALKTALSQKFISKPSLSIILEMIKLLFDVRESIQDAFGSILFMIILVMTFEAAESSFATIHVCEREPENIATWLDYLVWFLLLWSELVYIFVSFNRIGEVVSEVKESNSIFQLNIE